MKPKAIICDIDGTLANIDHRRHFVDPRYNKDYVFIEGLCPKSSYWEKIRSNVIFKPDWDSFNAAMIHDTPNQWCIDMCKMYDEKQASVLWVTGRQEKYRIETLRQILNWSKPYNYSPHHRLSYTMLFMRSDHDFRPAVEIKQEIYENHIRDNYDVLFCLDDNAEIVGLWRSLGLVCLDCAGYRR